MMPRLYFPMAPRFQVLSMVVAAVSFSRFSLVNAFSPNPPSGLTRVGPSATSNVFPSSTPWATPSSYTFHHSSHFYKVKRDSEALSHRRHVALFMRGRNPDIFGGGSFPPRRRWRRISPYRRFRGKVTAQRVLIAVNVLFFINQVRSAILYLPTLNTVISRSGYHGPVVDIVDLLEMMTLGSSPIAVTSASRPSLGSQTRAYGQSLLVASSLGPFTMDFVHQQLLTRIQPHRLITAGFLHGSLLHMAFNMRYLWKMPCWLEGGLGWPLYLSTYLVSVVTGNIAHSYAATTGQGVSSLCLGSSGGICGLNGLMFIELVKMGNKKASQTVFRNMIWLVLFGLFFEGISNAAHVGGFLGGAAVGILFGPKYGKSYAMMRKWSLEVDSAPLDYRRAMGFGVETKKGMFPLKYLWIGMSLAFFLRPELRTIPGCIARGFMQPGSLSGMRMRI